MSRDDPVPGWPGTDAGSGAEPGPGTPGDPWQRPAWQQAAVPFETMPWRSSATRARWAQALLVLDLLVALAAIPVYLRLLELGRDLDSFGFDLEAYESTAALLSLIGVAQVLLVLATAAAFIAWQSRVVEGLPALGLGQPRWSPRWAIVFWFIPLASLLMPYLSMRDTARRLPGGPWSVLMVGWWIAWVGAAVLDRVLAADPGPTVETVAAVEAWIGRVLTVGVVTQVLFAIAALLALLLVRRMEQATVAAAASRPPDWTAPPDASPPAWVVSASGTDRWA